MPQFIMNDVNTPEFSQLDHFTQGYIQAMFFTECEGSLHDGTFDPENGSQLPDEAGFLNLAADDLKAIIEVCKDFQEANAEALEEAYATREGLAMAYDDEQAGMDFWYTRNGHGVGFWDRGLGDVGKRLTAAAKHYGECYVYWVGETEEDGKVHLG